MHELMVTESILEIALRHADQAKAARISDVYLVIGSLSSVIDESVQFYWDFVSEGTIAEGAILHFKRIAAELACRACGHTYSPKEGLTCPVCSGSDIHINSGKEFFLEAIEIAEHPVGKPATLKGEAIT
jgi:hydrogenase nickel incorporation protein HypA/HybF